MSITVMSQQQQEDERLAGQHKQNLQLFLLLTKAEICLPPCQGWEGGKNSRAAEHH